MCLTIGRPLTGIVLGIFNSDNIDCASRNFTFDCYSQSLSCFYIDAISDKIFHKQFFTTFDDAFLNAKVGNIMMEIPSNFSNELINAQIQKRPEKVIKIYSDQTNVIQFQLTKFELIRAYGDFLENAMTKCNLSLKYFQTQMIFTDEKGNNFEKSIDYQKALIPPMFLV